MVHLGIASVSTGRRAWDGCGDRGPRGSPGTGDRDLAQCKVGRRAALWDGPSARWSRWGEGTEGQRGGGQAGSHPPLMTKRPLCSTHGLQAPLAAGKEKSLSPSGSGSQLLPDNGGIDRLGEVLPQSRPPPSARFPVSSGQDPAACNWIRPGLPRLLSVALQGPQHWGCVPGVCLSPGAAIPPPEGQKPLLRPELPPWALPEGGQLVFFKPVVLGLLASGNRWWAGEAILHLPCPSCGHR